MKKIVVFGAAGRTGRMVVAYALEAGHQVTAFVRNHGLEINHPNLTTIRGDVYNQSQVEQAIAGQEVVISTLGTNDITGDAVNLMSDAMKLFVDAMQKHGIKRVLAVGGLGVLQMNETMQLLDKPDYPAEYKNVGEGHNKVYKVLRETNLDWTFICCPNIVDGNRSGTYRVKKDYKPEGEFEIKTGDLADFILTEMEANQFTGTRVGICNF